MNGDRMHARLLALCVVVLVTACHHTERARFRLTPPTALHSDSARIGEEAGRTGAVTAVEAVALRFGLAPQRPGPECARSWLMPGHTRPAPQQPIGGLFLCVVLTPDGSLELHLAEMRTIGWSSTADSLRRAMIDTLAHYGAVNTVGIR